MVLILCYWFAISCNALSKSLKFLNSLHSLSIPQRTQQKTVPKVMSFCCLYNN